MMNKTKLEVMIRQEMPNDYSEVFEVNQLAFGQENEAKLVDALRENPSVFVPELSLVAIENDKMCRTCVVYENHDKRQQW